VELGVDDGKGVAYNIRRRVTHWVLGIVKDRRIAAGRGLAVEAGTDGAAVGETRWRCRAGRVDDYGRCGRARVAATCTRGTAGEIIEDQVAGGGSGLTLVHRTTGVARSAVTNAVIRIRVKGLQI
jgi:hypothetical protein